MVAQALHRLGDASMLLSTCSSRTTSRPWCLFRSSLCTLPSRDLKSCSRDQVCHVLVRILFCFSSSRSMLFSPVVLRWSPVCCPPKLALASLMDIFSQSLERGKQANLSWDCNIHDVSAHALVPGRPSNITQSWEPKTVPPISINIPKNQTKMLALTSER